MRRLSATSLALAIATTSLPASVQAADWLLGISAGQGIQNITYTGVRVGRDVGPLWAPSEHFWITTQMEVSATFWSQPEAQIADMGFNPILRFEIRGTKTSFFFDFSVGPHYLTNSQLQNRNIGSCFQFGDYFGFGVGLGPDRWAEFGFRFEHYSNANLWLPNPGVNLGVLTLSVRLI